MKVLLLLLFVTLASSADTVHDGEIFDKFNMIEILDNSTERKAVLDCVMGRSPCGQYQLIKDKGSNILMTRCADCTIEQKEKFEAAIKKFEIEHYDEYEQLMAKYVIAPAK